MPDPTITYRDARRELGIAPDQFVAGIFGTIGPSRPLRHIRAAIDALSGRDPDLLVLYVGPHGPDLRAALGNVNFRDAGPLPSPDVSRHLAAMDIHLSPFADGMSSRRGSCLAGLQHAVATVSTDGVHTESVFLDARGSALALAPVGNPDAFAREALQLWDDPINRHRLGQTGQELYQSRCDWPVIADRLLSTLQTSALASERLIAT
jgi:glycosyltransferase involved in cell wall biosynthesis